MTDGKETLETFTIDSLHTEPGVEEILTIPHSAVEWKDNRDYYLNISVREKKETAWAPAGHELGHYQFPLSEKKTVSVKREELPVSVSETATEVSISCQDVVYSFDKVHGVLSSMKKGGQELVKRGPVLTVDRLILTTTCTRSMTGRITTLFPEEWRRWST